MKHVLFLLLLPFFIQAQSTTERRLFDDPNKQEAWDKLEGYRQRVLKGESMSTIASLYTEDPGSAKTGGAYFNVARGQFVPEFENAAFNLQPGGISEIFETDYGFHFVQLIARRGDAIDVRHILVKTK